MSTEPSFDRLEEKEADDPTIVNYEALTLQARLALAKLVVALALERLDRYRAAGCHP
ncbi:hypothetical protein [Porphyromonas gingivalis]|uniref:hypothetical protein n=1 Tax=Porphyromonas gingivalis TaxID=837 RepID=UPI0012FDB5AD|nr:hypothetical protein [Porphyromonas gingivalis]